MKRAPRVVMAALLAGSAAVGRAAPGAEVPELLEVDAAWARRAEGANGGEALEGAVTTLVDTARRAVAAHPRNLDARWRLMRALYFQGEHATRGAEAKKKVFEEGKRLGEETLDLVRLEAGAAAGKDLSKAAPDELVPYLRGRSDVTACFLWAAVDWGKWALVFGKTAAARQGAAARIRDYAKAVIGLDPSFDEGGGYRVLGRLHHQTPSIPFITGWASRTEALKNLRAAVETAPKNFVNRLYLAEALHDYEKARRGEAVQMLETLVAETPSSALAVEDARAQEDARALLVAWKKG